MSKNVYSGGDFRQLNADASEIDVASDKPDEDAFVFDALDRVVLHIEMYTDVTKQNEKL